MLAAPVALHRDLYHSACHVPHTKKDSASGWDQNRSPQYCTVLQVRSKLSVATEKLQNNHFMLFQDFQVLLS